MNNILLAIDITDPNYVPGTISEKLSYGGQMLAVGMLTVFSVLIIIWFSLVIFKKLFYRQRIKYRQYSRHRTRFQL